VKIILIYPGIAGYGFNSLGQGMGAGWINHGLAQLSACIKAEGFDVSLIDLRALSGWDHLHTELIQRAPDVVGLTMMSVDFNPATKVAEIVKETDPGIVTVVGGPHPTLVLEEVAANPHFDYIVTHEGEITFPRLLQAIAENRPPQERVLHGERPDLDGIPFVDRDLFLGEWHRFGYAVPSPEVPFVEELPAPFLTIIAGRGCVYNCNFCQPAEREIFGRFRQRSVSSVIAELKELQDRFHFASFMFHDDCLTNNRLWIEEFCQAYRDEGFRQPFFCQSRADIIVRHEGMVERMVGAGLRGYFIGLESGSDRVLGFLRKGTTREINLRAAEVCKRYGIKIWANYMLGLPTETQEEVKETISMLTEIDPDYYSPAFYTPHPGSDLYDYCIENDLSLITSHDQYRRNPTETKIKGQDYEFLKWAVEESQRRKPVNALQRQARACWRRYARPRKVWRKLREIMS
jgi:anaerobic magnesium-protoporphyrin IX monomethyl ester cyclase